MFFYLPAGTYFSAKSSAEVRLSDKHLLLETDQQLQFMLFSGLKEAERECGGVGFSVAELPGYYLLDL